MRSIVVLLATTFIFATACSFAATAPDVMLVCTAVTLDAIVEPADPFLDVLAANACGGMFVAAVAGIALVVVAHVAGHAAGVVVAVEGEIPVVLECGRYPFLPVVALAAIAADLLVQRIGG